MVNSKGCRIHFIVTPEMLKFFCQLTGDRSSLHTNSVFARRSLYRENVVHGMLPLLFLSLINPSSSAKKYSLSRIGALFLKPAFIGDELDLIWKALPPVKNNSDINGEFFLKNIKNDSVLTSGSLTLTSNFVQEKQNAKSTQTILSNKSLLLNLLREANLTLDQIKAGDERQFAFALSNQTTQLAAKVLKSGLGDANVSTSKAPSKTGFDINNLMAASLLSTFVGLCLPGRYATFMDFQLNFQKNIAQKKKYVLKGRIDFKSDSTATLVEAVSILDSAGIPMATGHVKAKVNPPDVQMPTMDELKKDVGNVDFKGRVALITGASRGIGEVIAKYFSLHGAKVVINYAKSKSDAHRVAREIKKNGGQALVVQADITDRAEVKRMISAVISKFGSIDILVNNAVRSFYPIALNELSWEEIQKDIDVNVKGAFYCCQEIIPLMRQRKSGKIINLSTVAVENPPAGQAKYVISKAALEGLTKSLAVELAGDHIQAHCVVPSLVETDLTKHISKIFTEKIKKVKPVDVARAVMNLAAPENATTGQRVVLTGDSLSTLLPPRKNVTIQGRAVALKPISQKEINGQYIAWLHDPQVNQFLDEARHRTQTQESIVEYINGLRKKEGCELFAVFSNHNGAHIGNIGVTVFNAKQGLAGYGIMMGDKTARMMGLGGEATLLIVEYLFRQSQVRRIEEHTYSVNERSWATLESLGFKKEGVLRQHIVLSNGKVCDMFIHGLLKDEWVKERQKFQAILSTVKIYPP